MLSFSRFPYAEYHSSRDSVEIIKEANLNEAVDALIGAIDRLESSAMVLKKFRGNICLSNPQYDLYMDYGQIALGDETIRPPSPHEEPDGLCPGVGAPSHGEGHR